MAAAPQPRNRQQVDDGIRAEQVQLLYEQAPPAALISAFVAAMLCLLLWERTARVRLLGWLATVAVLAVVRLLIVHRYRRRPIAGGDVARWERMFLVTLVLTGVAWGIGGWVVMPRDSLAYQAVVYFFMMGMAGGAVASYGAHTLAVTATITTVMLPTTLWFAWQGDLVMRTMALGGFLYVVAAFRATRMLAFFLRRSFQLSQELQAAHAEAEKLARTDDLTGLPNRRACRELGEFVFTQARRYGGAISMLMIDVDHFKRINDRWGHAAGDQALRAVSQIIQSSVREADIAGRWGGEEFAVVLPATEVDKAALLAERLRKRISAEPIRFDGLEMALTSSLGVAGMDDGCKTLDALIARADAALNQAKQAGRDRVVCMGDYSGSGSAGDGAEESAASSSDGSTGTS